MRGIFLKFRDLIYIIRNSRKVIRSRQCILCSNQKFLLILPLKEDPNLLMITCLKYGLTRIDPMPSNHFYQNYYKSQYNKEYGIPQATKNPSERGKTIYEFIKGEISQIKGVFEVGCGGGGNLQAFKIINENVKLGGIDPSNTAILQAKELGVEVIQGFSDDLSEKLLKNYNLVIISHVLEHFVNPYDTLLKLRGIINHDTFIYIETPDSEFPDLINGLSNYWFRLSHTYYFNRINIWRLFKKCGFSVLKFEQTNRVLKFLLKVDSNLDQYEQITEFYGKRQALAFKLAALKSILYIPIILINKFRNLF